jgi:hypothetical protein
MQYPFNDMPQVADMMKPAVFHYSVILQFRCSVPSPQSNDQFLLSCDPGDFLLSALPLLPQNPQNQKI